MSMNSDVGFELSEIHSLYVLDSNGQEVSVARKFQLRAAELAKQGILGSLRTRKASLQNSYSLLVSLVDNMSVPVMLYGEKGAGKRRLVEEFLTVQNFYRRLAAKEMGKLRVLQAELLQEGFSDQFMASDTESGVSTAGDLIYVENVDALKEKCQIELLNHLKARKKLVEKGVALPRLIVGTEKALSIMVIRKEFSRELFQVLTSFAIFLPALNERGEDMVNLIQSIVEDITGRLQTPPAWLVDLLSHQLWGENIDELKALLNKLLQKNSDVAQWRLTDLPSQFQPFTTKKSEMDFDSTLPEEVGEEIEERNLLKKILLKTGGNRDAAALEMGLTKAMFLKKLMTYGLR